MIPFNKFKDTLFTSELYEKQFRHCKSDVHINGLENGRVYLTTTSSLKGAKVSDSHIDKIKYHAFAIVDYIHSPSGVIKYNPRTPDFLMPGYKIKIR